MPQTPWSHLAGNVSVRGIEMNLALWVNFLKTAVLNILLEVKLNPVIGFETNPLLRLSSDFVLGL